MTTQFPRNTAVGGSVVLVLLVLLANLVILGASVWVIVWVLQAMGVLA